MNVQEFISALKSEVEGPAVDGVVSQMIEPSGRKPPEAIRQLSQWYLSLRESDRKMVREVAQQSANSAIFGFLCVIDGVRTIESGAKKGNLELWYELDGNRVMLNNSANNMLHDEYNSES